MMVLDTDHFSEFLKGVSRSAENLRSRLASAATPVAVSIVTGEEMMRGWLAQIHRQRNVRNQIDPYARLQQLLTSLASWTVLPWDAAAVKQFENLRTKKIRVGTMDLKIAAIALVHGATLLTRNRVDFEHVPNLALDNWLDDAT